MKLRILLALVAVAMFVVSATARADPESDLKAKIDALQKQLDDVKAQLNQVMKSVQQQKEAQQEQEKKNEEQEKKNELFVQRVPGAGMTFLTPGGTLQVYGNLDVSYDYTTKGLDSSYAIGGSPYGTVGWLGAISTNSSYVGVRGQQDLGHALGNTNFVYQFETQLDISATAGTVNNNSSNDSVVKGALTTRNSFIGFASKDWGAVKWGKTDAPFKNSTTRLNPFSSQIGDYASIIDNTGGDNRVEFEGRLDHSIWYESPNLNGFNFNILYQPGQNRDSSNENGLIAIGETSCNGQNVPGSGALPPMCSDGSWTWAISTDLTYTSANLYGSVAYEFHKNVNRISDTIGLPTTPAADVSGDPNDVGDEYAFKAAIQYTFPTNTTVGFIWERTWRRVPGYLEYQNERTRPNATWLELTQVLTPSDNVDFGWAHAGGTTGDPGQHNTNFGLNPDNSSNMYTLDWKHWLDKSLYLYAAWALQENHPAAHYDLGAGGRANTTDCHDGSVLAAFDPTANNGAGGVTGNGPHCYAGGRLQGVSAGVNFKF